MCTEGTPAPFAACPRRTPLHCAASCNNVQVCKFLVESGAAVFATTYSDMQTAADKCEEMEEGYTQCSQFLYGACLPRPARASLPQFARSHWGVVLPSDFSTWEGIRVSSTDLAVRHRAAL